ncbi:MAG TPA: hypothetical protein VK427_26250 [Kofleriaceae bacterium]|nr:hypothetical protein [Kofleriaceae bacterium]
MTRNSLLITLALTIFAPTIAFADIDKSQPSPEVSAPAKSPRAALAIASGSTLAGLAISVAVTPIVAGAPEAPLAATGYGGLAVAVAAPSMGHVYAGEYGRAVVTTGLRACGVAAIIGGAEMISFDDDNTNFAMGGTLMALGAGTILATTVYDIYDAPRAAKRTSARPITVAPVAAAGTAGLFVAGQF